MRNSVVEPYNTVLCSPFLSNHNDMTVLFDNEQINKVCKDKLGIDHPNYSDVNAVVADHLSSSIASMRFNGNMGLHDL